MYITDISSSVVQLAKKRGQKKKAGDAAPGAITPAASESPVIPSRTFSPAPSEASLAAPANGDDKRDLADVYVQSEPVSNEIFK